MIDLNDRKELFSLAYIRAVAAHAGYQVVVPRTDKDSVDGVLMGDEGRRPRIEFQAKATSQDVLGAEHLAFALPVKNYNDLRADVIVPRLLIVVLMPGAESDWLVHSEEELRLRRCGYWLSLVGTEATDNVTSATIRIPRSQVFDTTQVRQLMARAERGEPL